MMKTNPIDANTKLKTPRLFFAVCFGNLRYISTLSYDCK